MITLLLYKGGSISVVIFIKQLILSTNAHSAHLFCIMTCADMLLVEAPDNVTQARLRIHCTVELQWLEHGWLIYHGCFELVLKSLGKNPVAADVG